ncbi:MAG: type II secretion system protein GspG [bacterium]
MKDKVTNTHIDKNALYIARCVVCGKYLCPDCVEEREGRLLCKECASKYTSPEPLSKERPYTLWVLIGMSVVIAIVGVVLAVVTISPYLQDGLKSNANLIKMKKLQIVLNEMFNDIGRYPSQEEGLALLTDNDPLKTGNKVPNWFGPYIPIGNDELLYDIYGNRLIYGVVDNSSYIESLGENGKLDYIPINSNDRPPSDVDDEIIFINPPEKKVQEEKLIFGKPVVRGGWW